MSDGITMPNTVIECVMSRSDDTSFDCGAAATALVDAA